jgi:hypothetical protein
VEEFGFCSECHEKPRGDTNRLKSSKGDSSFGVWRKRRRRVSKKACGYPGKRQWDRHQSGGRSHGFWICLEGGAAREVRKRGGRVAAGEWKRLGRDEGPGRTSLESIETLLFF